MTPEIEVGMPAEDGAPGPFDPPASGLGGRATSGALKTGLSQGVRLLVQFGSVIVLSRLLPPPDFGLVAMASPVVYFAALFQELGMVQAVVQKPKITQAEISTLFAISVGMSALVALILLALSPLVSWFYAEPRAGFLTAMLGFNIVLGGAGALPAALLNRRMQFGTLAVVDATGAVGGLLAAIVCALLTHSFWALYAGSAAGSLIPTIGYWIAAKWRPSLPRRGAGIGAALKFGANVTGFNLAYFFAGNLDNILIGRVWGEMPLGLYDRAYKLLLFPLRQVTWPMAKIMLPVLSQLAAEPVRYRQAYLRALAQMLLLTLPGVMFMLGTADILIPTLLGRQWAGAAPIFVALGTAGVTQVVNHTTGWLFMSQGRTREYLFYGLFASATCIASFIIGLPYGPFGVAVAYAIGEYVRTPCLWWYLCRNGPVRPLDAVRHIWPHYAGAAMSLAAILAARSVTPSAAMVVLPLCVVLSYGISALAIGASPQGRMTLGVSWRLALSLVPDGVRGLLRQAA